MRGTRGVSAMNSLFVTFFHAPLRNTDHSGITRRYEPILRALSRVSDTITAVHIVPPELVGQNPDLVELSREHSEFWNVAMQVRLIPRGARPNTTWNHYVPGITRASAQPQLSSYAAPSVFRHLAPFLEAGPDLVLAHQLPAMLPILQSGIAPRRLIYDVDDLPHSQLARQALTPPRYPGKFAKLLHLPALIGLIRQCVAAADISLVCSTLDQAKLRTITRAGRCEVVHNAIAFPAAVPGPGDECSVLFVGDANNPPNRAGAERMVNEIWPLVRQSVPHARLTIAGKGSDTLPSAALGLTGVEHLGFVHNLDALYARTRVVCCPLVSGSGTRLKLVEAAAYARPIVSTTIGAEGLGLVNGEHALLRDDARSFAAACVELFNDGAKCHRLGAAGRAHMMQAFDSREVEHQMVGLMEGLVQEG